MSFLHIAHNIFCRKSLCDCSSTVLKFSQVLCGGLKERFPQRYLSSSVASRVKALEVSTVHCGSADSIEYLVDEAVYDLEPQGWQEMKHKKKKSHKRSKKHSLYKCKVPRSKASNLKKFKNIDEKIKHLAMSSGFQEPLMLPLCDGKTIDENADDDIVVVYDKLQERSKAGKRMRNEGKSVSHTQCDVKVEDIPLPPEDWISDCVKLTQAIDLSEIPLPPNPEIHDRNATSELSCSLENSNEEVKQLRRFLKNIRKWENTRIGARMHDKSGSSYWERSSANSFTVMSYNVLAQKLLEDHPYLYRGISSRVLEWEYRSRTLLKEIQEADADILCLQEVQASHLDPFYSQLNKIGYEGVFKKRTNERVDGCAIYFKSAKFQLIKSSTVEYFQNYQPNLSILDRDNVAIIAQLKLKGVDDEDNHIVVATTHLLYNPRRQDVKLAQTQVLLAELDRASFIKFDDESGRALHMPIILTGDFNLEPHSAVYRLLVEGSLNYGKLTSRTLLASSYRQPCQEMLIPPLLQISSSCQHLGLLQHRANLKKSFREGEINDIDLSMLFNSDSYKSVKEYLTKISKKPLLDEKNVYQALGIRSRAPPASLYHNLNFQSVYKHERKSATSKKMISEATTHQDDWVTVDYIFYSGSWNYESRCVEEGRLKLLSRFTLPTVGQCHELKKLPNLVCGSDHLSLMAHFVLMPSEK